MDPDTRRLVLFAAGLAAVLLSLIGASTLIGHRSTDVPVITADPRPVKIKPENPGGMKIDGAENDVFSGGSDTANSRLAPPAENPDANALRTNAPPPATSAPTLLAPPPAPPATRSAAASGVETANPPAAATKVTPPKPAAAAESHASDPGHPASVQIAALASEDAARKEWQQLEKRMPELLGGKQPVFSRIERGGHTFWRIRTAGFADVAQARSFCDHVRSKGAGCSVADF